MSEDNGQGICKKVRNEATSTFTIIQCFGQGNPMRKGKRDTSVAGNVKLYFQIRIKPKTIMDNRGGKVGGNNSQSK